MVIKVGSPTVIVKLGKSVLNLLEDLKQYCKQIPIAIVAMIMSSKGNYRLG